MRRNRRKTSRTEGIGNRGERLVLCKRKHANERENKFACEKKERSSLNMEDCTRKEICMELEFVQRGMNACTRRKLLRGSVEICTRENGRLNESQELVEKKGGRLYKK